MHFVCQELSGSFCAEIVSLRAARGKGHAMEENLGLGFCP